MSQEIKVELAQMLEARERRAYMQRELLQKYNKTMVSFSMNIAGPIKTNSLITRGFDLGCRYLAEQLQANKIDVVYRQDIHEATGDEAYFILNAAPLTVKAITADIEDATPLGRLFDMDVLCPDGTKVERTQLGLPGRKCLICGKPAKECSRSRTHTVADLQARTKEILEEAILNADVADLSAMAMRALLYEVSTTPKPGLVDRNNSGSHRDMDIFTFINSASALGPYFTDCYRVGKKTSTLEATATFARIRPLGREAEGHMYAVTGGVNTHKGAIFSMGILCAALGRLDRADWKNTDRILNECAAMTNGLIEKDFAGLTAENAATMGQKLYVNYGITGIRGQVAAGFPAVRETGLPVLRQGINKGLSYNDAGCACLLSLMTSATDTNLIARSNMQVYEETIAKIKAILADHPYPDSDTLLALDQDFIEKNLSPGGSADLLAICYFLYFLESQN